MCHLEQKVRVNTLLSIILYNNFQFFTFEEPPKKPQKTPKTKQNQKTKKNLHK